MGLLLLMSLSGCSIDSGCCVLAKKRKHTMRDSRIRNILRLSPECKNGDVDACTALGNIYATAGWGGGKKIFLVKILYNQACSGGKGDGCFEIGACGQGCGFGHKQSCEFADCVSIDVEEVSQVNRRTIGIPEST